MTVSIYTALLLSLLCQLTSFQLTSPPLSGTIEPLRTLIGIYLIKSARRTFHNQDALVKLGTQMQVPYSLSLSSDNQQKDAEHFHVLPPVLEIRILPFLDCDEGRHHCFICRRYTSCVIGVIITMEKWQHLLNGIQMQVPLSLSLSSENRRRMQNISM